MNFNSLVVLMLNTKSEEYCPPKYGKLLPKKSFYLMVDAMAAFLWHDPSNEIGDTIKIITSKGMVYLWAVNRTFLTGKGRTSVLCLEVGINPRTELEPDDFKQYIELNWVDDVFPV